MQPVTLYDLFRQSIERYADRPFASMFEGETVPYRLMGERTAALRQTLREAGLQKGDKVVLLSSNMPNWAVAYFAVTTAGMVVVPILPDFSASELDRIITHSEARGLLVSDKLYGKLSEDTVRRMNVVIRTKNLGVISRREGPAAKAALPGPDDLAAIIYTSGTTSAPKGVMLTHRNLTAQMLMCRDLFPIGPQDTMLSVLPLSHTYECSLGMIYPFVSGAQVVYLDRPPTASALLPAMRAVRPTLMLVVPLIIEKIYKQQVVARFRSHALLQKLYGWSRARRLLHRMVGRRLMRLFGGRMRFLGIGGAKLDTETERFLLDARLPYAIGYGLTETAPLLAGAAPSMVRLGSTGPVLQGIEVRLEEVNPVTGEGEIVVKSPSTMCGYYKNPEATREVLSPDGWFHTKDLARIDADGYLYIRGRLGNMIVGPSGENIYPEEIESVLNGHALVQDSVVTEREGRLVALVRFNTEELERRYRDLKENWRLKMDEIKTDVMHYVNSKVGRFSRITQVEAQEKDFEKTPTQKIKRFLYTRDRHS